MTYFCQVKFSKYNCNILRLGNEIIVFSCLLLCICGSYLKFSHSILIQYALKYLRELRSSILINVLNKIVLLILICKIIVIIFIFALNIYITAITRINITSVYKINFLFSYTKKDTTSSVPKSILIHRLSLADTYFHQIYFLRFI